MRLLIQTAVVLLVLFTVQLSHGKDGNAKKAGRKSAAQLSFKADVFPIIQARCLPCHAEDNFNPSELSMDDYEKMSEGGKHGKVWVAGNSRESLIIKKLSEKPPFGDRMPLNSKKKIEEGKAKWLTEDEIKTIAQWIDDGAKNN